jgi:GNAT superfamily N-acetyltransferase
MRPASPADLPAITALLVRANETPYDIACVAEEKVFGRGFRGEPVVRVYEESGVIRGVAVRCGNVLRLIAVDPEHRRRGIGSVLMSAEMGARSAEEGHRSALRPPLSALTAFAEAGNYFTPGVIESDAGTRAFFARHGFIEERWTSNLETTQLPEAIPSEVQRVSSANRERVLEFVAREFGPAWRFECENAGDRLFFIEHDAVIAGFAAHDANNRGLGFFGPTGVAESMRGRGFGTLLLRASLTDLRTLGYARVIIPWTDAIEFYAKACGARVSRRFVMMTSGQWAARSAQR